MKTPDRRRRRGSGIFIVDFEHILHHIFIVDFEQVNISSEINTNLH